MRIIRFEAEDGAVHLGEPLDDGRANLIDGDLFGAFETTTETMTVRRLLSPVSPVNVVAIGLNYRRHAEEGGVRVPKEPLVFAKLTTAVISPGDPILLPQSAPDEVDYEAELAVVIGKEARRVPRDHALDYVLGYTCGNDVSARDCQKSRDKQWTRGKSFDTFCPLGPCLLTAEGINPNDLVIQSELNGRIMQDSNTGDMIFPVPDLISFLSHQFTLVPGTVIMTGTPEGVGFARKPPVYLQDGDTITIRIAGIGELTNPVRLG